MNAWRKFVLGCAVGNLLEWYDFILFGFFAQVFSTIFFPHQDPFLALLLTFTVFASGCFIRPLSSMLFGHVGDRQGRKKALVYSIFLITISTTMMGILPTYQQVGYLAPLALVACRLVQGMAVSGEEIGAVILLSENAPKEQQSLMGSIVLSSVYMGLFLGSVSVLLVYLFCSEYFLMQWGWRIPFLVAGVLGVISLRIRLNALESREFLAVQSRNQVLPRPLVTLAKEYRPELLKAVMLSAVLAVAIYLFAVFLPSYLAKMAGFSTVESLKISSVFLLLISLLVPIIGYWADRTSPYLFMKMGCIGFLACSYPIFFLLSLNTLASAIIAELMLIVLLAFIAGSILPLVIHQFPANVRYSGACVGFNLSMTLFGSTAPIIALSLQRYLHSDTAPFIYLLAAALISLTALRMNQYGGRRAQHYFSEEMAGVTHG